MLVPYEPYTTFHMGLVLTFLHLGEVEDFSVYSMNISPTIFLIFFVVVLQVTLGSLASKDNTKKKKKEADVSKKEKLKIGKKVTDYTDNDIEKLLDQWDENDDDYEDEEDDKPWLKPKPKIDMQKIMASGGNKEDIVMASKKGQPLMIFANVAGNPTKKQTDKISAMWQQSLQNANIQVQRYIVSDNRVLLQVSDGSLAFQIKDFLVTQDTCESVSFENMDFDGKGKGRQKVEL